MLTARVDNVLPIIGQLLGCWQSILEFIYCETVKYKERSNQCYGSISKTKSLLKLRSIFLIGRFSIIPIIKLICGDESACQHVVSVSKGRGEEGLVAKYIKLLYPYLATEFVNLLQSFYFLTSILIKVPQYLCSRRCLVSQVDWVNL